MAIASMGHLFRATTVLTSGSFQPTAAGTGCGSCRREPGKFSRDENYACQPQQNNKGFSFDAFGKYKMDFDCDHSVARIVLPR